MPNDKETGAFAVYAVEWTEYERGWGQRPDGISYHRTKEDALTFTKQYESVSKTPHYYSLGEEPMLIGVDEETYRFIENANSNRLWDRDITFLKVKAREAILQEATITVTFKEVVDACQKSNLDVSDIAKITNHLFKDVK
jgi:hypothetical protein